MSALTEKVNFDDLEKMSREYNENIETLDPDYANLLPMRGVIVRMERREIVKSDGGIWQPDEIEIAVGTKNGYFKEMARASYQFKRTGVVVASSTHYANMLPPGSLIMVDRNVVTPVKKTVDHPEDLPFAFMKPGFVGDLPPTSPMSKDFGYFMLEDPQTQIDVIISRPSKDEPS